MGKLICDDYYYIRLNNGTLWPATTNISRELEWQARYGSIESLVQNRFLFASTIAAYHALIDSTNLERNKICNELKF